MRWTILCCEPESELVCICTLVFLCIQILEYAISNMSVCVSVTENPHLTGSKSVAQTGVRRQDWQYDVCIVWKVYTCFLFLYRWEYDLSGCISPGRHQWDGRGSSPAGANAITYTFIQKQAQEKNTLFWFGLKDGKWKMQSKLVLSLRGVDVYSSPMSFVRGSAAITNPGLAGHAYLGSVNPSPLLAHSHINTSIHPLHTSHFVLEFLSFFFEWINISVARLSVAFMSRNCTFTF